MNLQKSINLLNNARRRVIISVIGCITYLLFYIYFMISRFNYIKTVQIDSIDDMMSSMMTNSLLMTIIFGGFILAGVLFFYAVVTYIKFKYVYKEVFVRIPLNDNFDNVNYEWAKGFSPDTIQKCFNFVSQVNRSEDLINASYKDIPFEMSDVMATFKTSGPKKHFRGRMLIIDLPDKILDSVQLFSTKFAKKYNISYTSNIEMDSVEFNREFMIKATDPHDAFYLLTPHMMEHISKMSTRFEGIVMHAFGNKVALALENKNIDSFDPKKWYKKVNYQNEISKVYKEIEDIKMIISNIYDLRSNPNENIH